MEEGQRVRRVPVVRFHKVWPHDDKLQARRSPWTVAAELPAGVWSGAGEDGGGFGVLALYVDDGCGGDVFGGLGVAVEF